MIDENCGLKSSTLEVRRGTRDKNKGCGGAKKIKNEGTRKVRWANAVIDWRGRERAGKEEQMRGERGGGAA